jgi:hypothetical protein
MNTITKLIKPIKRRVSNLLLIVGLVSAMCLAAQAQQYGALSLSTPNNIAATTTATYWTNGTLWSPAVFTLTKCDEVALQFTFVGLATNTGNVTFAFARSGDGTFFDTSPPAHLTFTVPSNGTNIATLTTNINFGAYGYLGLYYWSNAVSSILTNVVITNVTTTITATSTNYATNVVVTPIVQAYKKPLRRN